MYLIFGGIATVLSFVLFWAIDVFTPLDELILFIGIKLMDVNSLLVKAFAAIVIIVLNYIISKIWVFRDGRKEERKSE